MSNIQRSLIVASAAASGWLFIVYLGPVLVVWIDARILAAAVLFVGVLASSFVPGCPWVRRKE